MILSSSIVELLMYYFFVSDKEDYGNIILTITILLEMYQFVLSEWVKTEVEIKSSEVLWVECSESACDVIISWSTTDGYEIREIIFSLYSTELNHDSWHTFLFKTRWILTVWHLAMKRNSLWREKSNDVMRLSSSTGNTEPNLICKRCSLKHTLRVLLC